MDNQQFKNLITIAEFDIQVGVTGMIKSRKYYDNEIVEYGGYIAAHYTHIAIKEKIEMSEIEKTELIDHICDFYSRLIQPNGITKSDKQLIRSKFYELLNEDPNMIKSYIESIADVAFKKP